MARLRASWRTSLPVVQQPRNPQSESIARSPYEMRVALCDLADGFMRYMRDRAGGERHNAVVHPLEDEAVQIDEVARDMDGADPALAVAQDLVAPREALQEELALARMIPLPHHILALFDG